MARYTTRPAARHWIEDDAQPTDWHGGRATMEAIAPEGDTEPTGILTADGEMIHRVVKAPIGFGLGGE